MAGFEQTGAKLKPAWLKMAFLFFVTKKNSWELMGRRLKTNGKNPEDSISMGWKLDGEKQRNNSSRTEYSIFFQREGFFERGQLKTEVAYISGLGLLQVFWIKQDSKLHV